MTRFFVYLFLLSVWLTDMNSATLVHWIAPDFVERSDALAGKLEAIDQMTFGDMLNYVEEDEPSRIVDVGIEMLALNKEFFAWNFRGGAIRFLLTPVSPTAHGSLRDSTTWRKWFNTATTMVGVGKTILIASFYFALPFSLMYLCSLFRRSKEETDMQGVCVPPCYGIAYAVIGSVIFPIVTWLYSATDSIGSPGWRMAALAVAWIIRLLAGLVNTLAAKLVGTLILCVALPFSLVHAGVGWLIASAL